MIRQIFSLVMLGLRFYREIGGLTCKGPNPVGNPRASLMCRLLGSDGRVLANEETDRTEMTAPRIEMKDLIIESSAGDREAMSDSNAGMLKPGMLE